MPEIQRVRALGDQGALTVAMNTQLCVHTWPLAPAWNSLSTFTPSKGSNCTKPSILSLKEHCWPLPSPVDSSWFYMSIPKGTSSISIRKSFPLPLWQSFPSFFTIYTFGFFLEEEFSHFQKPIFTFSRSLFFIFLPEKSSPFNTKYNTKAFLIWSVSLSFFFLFLIFILNNYMKKKFKDFCCLVWYVYSLQTTTAFQANALANSVLYKAVQFVKYRLIIWLQANFESCHIQQFYFYFKLVTGFKYRIWICLYAWWMSCG